MAAFVAASTSHAALTFDLRAVSGSQVTIHNPKSVSVNYLSYGGWIDFELYALVSGANGTANDESIQIFVGNMLSTQIGHGAVSGSMVNSGEIATRVRRGVVPPLDHYAHSDGTVQNLDDDPDLEIGGNGPEGSTEGMIGGRGDPFRVRYYEGDGAVAEFLLYRFTLPIDSFLAHSLSDMTRVNFETPFFPTAFLWREDGDFYNPPGFGIKRPGTMLVNDAVLIHSAQTPEELALIPEPRTWLLAVTTFLALALSRRRSRGTLMRMNRSVTPVALAFFLFASAATARADFTFDLRAVSGSQVTIYNPKSVAVNHNSVGGSVDFELWGVVNGPNATPFDDWVQNFAGSMLSDQFGNGAVAGSMVNTGEISPRVRRGVVNPFDGPAYSDGSLRNLDNDPDLEIGGRDGPTQPGGLITARTGSNISYSGNASLAEFLLYRFTLPIEGINAQSLADITSVHFLPDSKPVSFLWFEDGVNLHKSTGNLNPGSAVLIHTADTPEELALIPEPSTWALGFTGLLVAGWFARRRRRTG